MGLTPISKSFFGVPEDADFNLDAAVEMYTRVMKMDDGEAQAYVRFAMFDGAQEDIAANKAAIQKCIDDWVAERSDLALRALARRVSKGADDAITNAAADVVAAISKADEIKGAAAASDWQRKQWASLQSRDPRGRFSRMTKKINYTWDKPLKGEHAAKMGIPKPEGLNDNERKRYQQAFVEVASLLNRAAAFGALGGSVATVRTAAGSKPGSAGREEKKLDITNVDQLVRPEMFKDNARIDEVVLDVDTLNANGAAFDLFGALGRPASDTAYQFKSSTGLLNTNGVKDFNAKWEKIRDEDYSTTAAGFKRLKTVAETLQGALPFADGKVKLALQAAKWAGEYGPEAEKVIGPGARKWGYRYRGIERKPDPKLQAAMTELTRKYPDGNTRRQVGIYGRTGPDGKHDESPVILYFRNRLKNPKLLRLQYESGHIPPSEGVIINNEGKITAQAVGYGDDWYLPFNFKNLSGLSGGEYIRTRAVGGLTTEDVYTGLVSGARAVTVVSNSGVYTMEFDDTLRGARRFNDKPARMPNRYAHLLDAVKSEQVTLSEPSPEKVAEIYDAANKKYPDRRDKDARKQWIKDMLEDERENPSLPESERLRVTKETIDTLLESSGTTYDQMARASASKAANQFGRDTLAPQRDGEPDEVYQNRVNQVDRDWLKLEMNNVYAREMEKLKDPVAFLANNPSIAVAVERAVRTAENKYRADMKPLKLDAIGYERAQKALEEQFPYYIANTHYRPIEDIKEPGLDPGYVAPGYNRPEMARAGFFDPIVGQEKTSAANLNYQNYVRRLTKDGKMIRSVEQMRNPKLGAKKEKNEADAEAERQERKAAREEKYSEETKRAQEAQPDPQLAKDRAYADLAKFVQAQAVFGPTFAVVELRGQPATTGVGRALLENQYELLIRSDIDLLDRMGDPAVAAKVKEQADLLIRQNMFDKLDPEFARIIDRIAGKSVAAPKATTPYDPAKFTKDNKVRFDFGYETPDASPEHYESLLLEVLDTQAGREAAGSAKSLDDISEVDLEKNRLAFRTGRIAYEEFLSERTPSTRISTFFDGTRWEGQIDDEEDYERKVLRFGEAVARIRELKLLKDAAVRRDMRLQAQAKPDVKVFEQVIHQAAPAPTGPVVQGEVVEEKTQSQPKPERPEIEGKAPWMEEAEPILRAMGVQPTWSGGQ